VGRPSRQVGFKSPHIICSTPCPFRYRPCPSGPVPASYHDCSAGPSTPPPWPHRVSSSALHLSRIDFTYLFPSEKRVDSQTNASSLPQFFSPSPQSISRHMLSKPSTNLNLQSQAATVHLITSITSALASRNPPAAISEIYVDALGPPQKYEQYLKHLFPNVDKIDVRAKADSIFKIVGAASVAAKVTRDAWVDNWVWEEDHRPSGAPPVEAKGKEGDKKSPIEGWTKDFGSGYPSDPNTRDWLANHFEPTFGFPSVARFSWAPVKTACETKGAKVLWYVPSCSIYGRFPSCPSVRFMLDGGH